MLKKLIEKIFKKETFTQGEVEMTTTLETPTLETPSKVYQSKWGYHPCDYKTYRKLKELHKWYWETVYNFHSWYRWYRKDKKNQRGSEPKYCEHFVVNKSWYKPVKRHGQVGCKRYPKTVVDHGVLDLFQQARMPQAEPPDPFSESQLKAIDELHEKCKEWFETEG